MTDRQPNQIAESLLRLIASNPRDVSLYCKLAQNYEAIGEFGKVELALRRAVEIEPRHYDAWLGLGTLHMNRGKWRAAVDAFEQATTLAPSSAPAWIAYGMAAIALQDLALARKARDTLIERFPNLSETHVLSGHVAKVFGRFSEAVECYRRALSLNTSHTAALYSLIELNTPKPSDPETEILQSLLRKPTLSQREAADIHFALGRIHEAAGDANRAFASYQAANTAVEHVMCAHGNAYRRLRSEQEAKLITELFNGALLRHPLKKLDIDMKLIFVVGLPRSGTTLVDRILSSHSRVLSGGELPFMQECLSALCSRLHARTGGTLNMEVEEDRLFLERLRITYLDGVFERDLDYDYVVDKLPANFSAIGLIRMLFPDASIVHCSRNPVATCWSLYSSRFDVHLSYNTSFEHLIHYYKQFYLKLMQHWRCANEMNIIDVSYEELVTNPTYTIGNLLAQCCLPFEEACLNFHENGTPIYTASVAQARQPIYTTSINRWKMFEQHLGRLIEGLRNPMGTQCVDIES